MLLHQPLSIPQIVPPAKGTNVLVIPVIRKDSRFDGILCLWQQSKDPVDLVVLQDFTARSQEIVNVVRDQLGELVAVD